MEVGWGHVVEDAHGPSGLKESLLRGGRGRGWTGGRGGVVEGFGVAPGAAETRELLKVNQQGVLSPTAGLVVGQEVENTGEEKCVLFKLWIGDYDCNFLNFSTRTMERDKR